MRGQHHIFLNRAIYLSQYGITNAIGGPFGAVIVKDNQIIAEAMNEVTSSCDPTAHAEIQAIRKASKLLNTFDLSSCIIYSSCEPCPMCLAAIYWAKIKEVYFANTRQEAAAIDFDDARLYTEMAKPIAQRSLTMQHMPNEHAREIFNKWAASDKKVLY